MPFEIVRNDITNMHVDAVVNAASRRPRVNSGVNMAIHKKAGPQLLEARRLIGEIALGDAAVTPAFGLNARYVIHAPTPVWNGGTQGEEALLMKTYGRCLQLALENGCESIAFPLLASGNHGFPKQRALRLAIHAFSDFLMQHDLLIYLVVFGKESFALSGKLFQNVTSYIDEHYVAEYERLYPPDLARRIRSDMYVPRRRMPAAPPHDDFCAASVGAPDAFLTEKSAASVSAPDDLSAFLKQKDAGFAVTLVELIERSGKKNSEIYKKANVDKKLFSKIINNVNYHPSKGTAVAFAIALELDLAQTQDLIGRAGYALTHSSKFDLIIEFFILNKRYNIFEINEVLFEFDEMLLGY